MIEDMDQSKLSVTGVKCCGWCEMTGPTSSSVVFSHCRVSTFNVFRQAALPKEDETDRRRGHWVKCAFYPDSQSSILNHTCGKCPNINHYFEIAV
jgi:hypothetical protein